MALLSALKSSVLGSPSLGTCHEGHLPGDSLSPCHCSLLPTLCCSLPALLAIPQSRQAHTNLRAFVPAVSFALVPSAWLPQRLQVSAEMATLLKFPQGLSHPPGPILPHPSTPAPLTPLFFLSALITFEHAL